LSAFVLKNIPKGRSINPGGKCGDFPYEGAGLIFLFFNDKNEFSARKSNKKEEAMLWN